MERADHVKRKCAVLGPTRRSTAWTDPTQEQKQAEDVLEETQPPLSQSNESLDDSEAALLAAQIDAPVARAELPFQEVEELLIQRLARNHALLGYARSGDEISLRAALDKDTDVNFTGAFKETALSLAAEYDRLVCLHLLIEKGAKLDIVDARQETALSLAAKRRHTEVVKALVHAGASLKTAIHVVTDVSLGIDFKALELLTSEEVIFSAPLPIRASFELTTLLKSLRLAQPERAVSYKTLESQCESMAVLLLDQCEDGWEVRRLLQKSSGLLDSAILHYQQRFIAHPATQAVLHERWYGEYVRLESTDFARLCLRYLGALMTLPFQLVRFYTLKKRYRVLQYSELGDLLRLCRTPFMKFFGAILSYLVFLALIIFSSTQRSEVKPTACECILAFWIGALVVAESLECSTIGCSRYLSSWWNVLDIIMLAGFSTVIVARCVAWASADSYSYLLFQADVVFAISATLTCLRLLYVFQTSSLLGPLLLTIFRVLRDLYKFAAVLLVFILAFSIALTKVFQSMERLTENTDSDQALGTLPRCLHWLFFSLFGQGSLVVFDIHGDHDLHIRAVGEFLFGIFMVIVVILLLNLLIAMINQTYQKVQDNSDVEWKFLRAKLIREFEQCSAFPPPLNLIGEPMYVLLRVLGVDLSQRLDIEYDAAAIKEETAQLERLNQHLVNRHLDMRKQNQTTTDARDISLLRNQLAQLQKLILSIVPSSETLQSAPSL
eukprot:m.70214 g.70214  ORF g.70214 m.70214 type:complete len:725 (-) comp50117_c1_seq1:145-2319(-)